MFDYQLYLGYPVSREFMQELEKVNPLQLDFYIQSDPQYLQKFEENGVIYLGKSLGNSLSLRDITLQKEHLLSLLKCLIPNYAYSHTSLKVIARNAI